MNGDLASCVFTDPPYGVTYTGAGRDDRMWEMIKGDDKRGDELLQLLIPAFKNMVNHTADEAGFYIWHGDIVADEVFHAIKVAGLMKKTAIIWAKNNFVLRHNGYHQMHEPCIYAEKQGNKARFFGDRTNTTLWRASLRRKGEISTSAGTRPEILRCNSQPLRPSNRQYNRLLCPRRPDVTIPPA